MDIYDRILDIEKRLTVLEGIVQGERTQTVRHREEKRTAYFPQVTEEMVELSKLDKRSEDTRVDKPHAKGTNPHMRAAVDAVSRAVEMQKEAQLLLEDVQHLARSLMDVDKDED